MRRSKRPAAAKIRPTSAWILGFLVSTTTSSELVGQTDGDSEGRPSIAAVQLRAGEGITLDGNVDEAVWQRAIPATGFLQRDPDQGAPATERTEVFVVYDASDLYIGAILYDSDPDGEIADVLNSEALFCVF